MGGESVATAKAGSFGNVELAYTHKVSEKVGLATELQYYHGQVCTFGLGYEFRLRQATFKGLIQSDTTCSAALEERVSTGVNLLLYHLTKHVHGGGAAARLLLGPKGESVATAKA